MSHIRLPEPTAPTTHTSTHQHEGHLENQVGNLAVVGEVAPAPLPVVAPAQNGGQGEEQQADLEHRAADGAGENGVERSGGSRAVGAVGVDVVLQHPGQEHRHGGEGADDDAEPRPASLENTPRAKPWRIATRMA